MHLKKEHLKYFLGYFRITFFGSLNKIYFQLNSIIYLKS